MIGREFGLFLIVGSLTVAVDYLTYRGIVWTGLLETNLAKGASFLTGTVFAYFANRVWTFSAHADASGSASRFVVLYALTLLMNVSANALVLHVLFGIRYAVPAAFVIATGLSAALNFLGMRHFVFVSKRLGSMR